MFSLQSQQAPWGEGVEILDKRRCLSFQEKKIGREKAKKNRGIRV